jgi:hypothetical protein
MSIIGKVFYALLVICLGYLFFRIDILLRKEFLKEKLTIGTSKLFFLALIFPKRYFKKDKILVGWLIYVLDLIVLFGTFYLLIKLIRTF